MIYKRIPLTVDAVFTRDGKIKPRKIILSEGTFLVDRVISVKARCPQVVSSVAPLEYSVMVEGCEKKIYFEPHSNTWFSVKKYERKSYITQ